MQTHTILIILGAVLLVAGVVGGGLTLKEIKLPSLDKFSRSLAGVVGVVFIVVGVYIEKGTGDAQDRTEEVVEQHQRQEEQRQTEVDSQREEAERKVELERQRREEERRVEIEEQKKKIQADFTKRALATPKNNAWHGEFRIYDPRSTRELANGKLIFGPTTHGDNIAYARIRVDNSNFRPLPSGPIEATKAVWGFMGESTDDAISIVFDNTKDKPILVFNKMTRDYDNGYLELRGVLFMTRNGKNEIVAHTSASCRAQ